MKHWKKRGFVLSLAGIIAAVSLMGCGGESVNHDETLVTIGDTEVPFGVANFYARLMQARYEDYYTSQFGTTSAEFWEQNFMGEVYEVSVKAELLQNLEEMYLTRQHAEEYGVELTEEEQKAIEKAASDFEESNSLEVKEKVSGYKKYIEEYLTTVTIWRKMEEPMREGVDEEVTDEEAAQKSMDYVLFPYTKEDENDSEEDKEAEDSKKEMTDEEKEEVKETAEKFLAGLKADKDKDIAAAAKEAGLEVETVTFNSDSTSPHIDLIEAADELKEGEITDLIDTSNGLYIGKVTSLLDREATDEEKDRIVEKRKSDQYNSLIEEWKEEADSVLSTELWEKISFAESGISDKQSGMSDKKDENAKEDTENDDANSDEPEETEDAEKSEDSDE